MWVWVFTQSSVCSLLLCFAFKESTFYLDHWIHNGFTICQLWRQLNHATYTGAESSNFRHSAKLNAAFVLYAETLELMQVLS